MMTAYLLEQPLTGRPFIFQIKQELVMFKSLGPQVEEKLKASFSP